MTGQLIKAYTIETPPIDYQNTFNLALYHLAAANLAESDRLYTSSLTAPKEFLEMAIFDLDDFLLSIPRSPPSPTDQTTAPRDAPTLNKRSPNSCVTVYICTYINRMSYQWDPDKANINRAKHSVDFADAVSVLEDDRAITVEDHRYDEERFITIGIDVIGRILVVVYTWRGNEIRLISARKADRLERQQYLED